MEKLINKNKKQKLFLLTTKSLGDYYVIVENSCEAEDILISLLTQAKYGLDYDRIVKNIEILTKEVISGLTSSPNFCNGSRLIIKDNWKAETKDHSRFSTSTAIRFTLKEGKCIDEKGNEITNDMLGMYKHEIHSDSGVLWLD